MRIGPYEVQDERSERAVERALADLDAALAALPGYAPAARMKAEILARRGGEVGGAR